MRRGAYAALAIVVVVLVSFRVATMSVNLGPENFDDNFYYSCARGLWSGDPPPGDWSPGFALLFAPFANPWVEKETAFLCARFVFSVTLAGLTFIAVRRVASPLLAAGACLVLAASHIATVYFVIRIGAALPVAAALAVVGRSPRRAGSALAILAFGIAVRPEFALAAMLAALFLTKWIRTSPRAFLPAVLIAASALLYQAIAPAHYEHRMLRAFSQHYAWGANERGDWDGDPWSHSAKLIERDFGPVTSFSGAVRADPGAVRKHFVHNLSLLPWRFAESIAPGRSARYRWVAIVLAGACLGLGLFAFVRDTPVAQRRLRESAPQLCLVLATASMFAVWLVIRPRPAVLFTVAPAVWLALTAFADLARPERS